MRFAREDTTELPGYDENLYAKTATASSRSLESILSELESVRTSTMYLFESFSKHALLRTGVCNEKEISVLGLGFTIIGHQIHHFNVINEKYADLDSTFNIESNIVKVKNEDKLSVDSFKLESNNNDIKKDYEYTRANLYSLIEKGQEAINGIMELAGESDSPRAYEVAGQLIKNVADTTDKLIDLQKKLKEVEEDATKTTNNVTNNAVFVGSTSELSKLLKQGFLNNKE